MPKSKESAPKHLSEESRTFFRYILRTYELEVHHVKVLTLACEALDRAEGARKFLEENGTTFQDRFSQPVSRPEVKIENDARLAFLRCLKALDLDYEAPGKPGRPEGH